MKQCFKCGESLPLDQFYRHPKMADGLLGKCKACTKKDVKARYELTRPERAAYEAERSRRPERRRAAVDYQKKRRHVHPERSAARHAVWRAVRDGILWRGPCEVCGTQTNVEAHHEDYGKPLEVRWLCFLHHRMVHGQKPVSTPG